MWRWLAVLFLALAAANLPAQQRYRTPRENVSWFRLRVTEIFLGMEVEGESEKSTLSTGTSPFKRDYLYIAPTLGLGLRGSVFHPNLLQFDLKAEDGISWQEQSLSEAAGASLAGTETKTRFLQRYHGELYVLKGKPYSASLYADRDHNFRQYDFFNRATVDSQRYGGRAGYATGPVPFSLTASHLEEDISSYTRPSILDETTLSLDMRNERQRDVKTTLSYNFDQYNRQELGVPLQKGAYHTVNVFDTEKFGKSDRVRLNSSLFFNQLHSTAVASRNLSIQEQASVEHSQQLQSDYQYGFDNHASGTTDGLGHNAQAALRHQLYQSLTSTLDLHGNMLDSTSPDSSLSTRRYGVGLNESYVKKLGSWGRLSLGYNGRYDKEQRETTGQTIFIIGETHTLTDGIITYLNQPRIEVSSIRVADSNSNKDYQPLLDYVVIEHGELTEIRRASGSSQIPNGGGVLVDYRVQVQPSDKFTTLANQIYFRLNLFKEMLGLYGRLNLVNNRGGETLVLQNISDKVLGADFSWRWARAGAEYEIYDSNLAPFKSKRLFQSLSFQPGRNSSLSFNLDQNWTTFAEAGIRRASYSFITRYRTQFTPRLSWEAESGLRLDRGAGFDQTQLVGRTGLEYSRGKVAMKLGYDFQDQNYLGETRQRHFFFLRARRTF
jgi:hypothetical protein